ncbi:MAG: ABC transporter ATP-binding protein [Pseudomonadota bacterium]
MNVQNTDTAAEAVVANGLGKRFGQKKALDDLDLRLGQRGITAILGANGAGKTTFIRCVLGLTRHDTGSISVFGHAPGSAAARSRTGVMLQDADLPHLLTPREHLTLFASYYDRPLGVDQAIATCDLTDFADKRYKKLSGGQKRRTQFALSVIGQPSLLFLDEPTTGLDTDARRTLWQTVRNLADAGTAIVLTTHYLEEADALADRVVVIRDGKVLTDASTQTIRETVGGSLIRCVTTAALNSVSALDGVRSVRTEGRFTELLCHDAPAALRALFAIDPSPQDLTVSKPSLEEAIAGLATVTP